MFNIGSVSAILLMPMLPVLLLWIAGSIVVYSANIFHPNPIVRRYTKLGGYRFYGFVGSLLVSMNFSSELKNLAGDSTTLLLLVWAIGVIVVVPFGIHAILRAGKEEWKELPLGDIQNSRIPLGQDA